MFCEFNIHVFHITYLPPATKLRQGYVFFQRRLWFCSSRACMSPGTYIPGHARLPAPSTHAPGHAHPRHTCPPGMHTAQACMPPGHARPTYPPGHARTPPGTHTPGHAPPCRMVNARAVRILLESNFVSFSSMLCFKFCSVYRFGFFLWPTVCVHCRLFNCNMEEAAIRDLKRYKNLSEFFSRRLRTGARPVDKHSTVVRDIYCEKKKICTCVK